MKLKRRYDAQRICKIDIARFASIAVVVILALIFSVAVSQTSLHDINSGVPKVRHPRFLPYAERGDAITVTIQRHGDIFLNRDRANRDQLAILIRRQLSQGAERRVYIRANARVPYSCVKEVLDEVREAGLDDVSFFTE